MSPRRLGAMLAGMLGGGLAGYLGGAISRPAAPESPDAGSVRASHAPLARPPAPPFAVAPLPEATFTDAVGFHAFVAGLGFSEKHAQWVALRMRAGQDMAASLALAREQRALDLWASGAAEVDPAQALLSVQGLPSEERAAAQAEFFATLGRRDPKLGLDLLSRLNPSDQAGVGATLSFFRNWAAVASSDTVAAAVKALPNRAQGLAMFGLFKTWGETDRAGMLEWASAQGPATAKRAFRALNDFSSGRNPEELFALAIQFPEAADWLTLAVANRQLPADETGFRVIAELPPGPIREDQISRFAGSFARRDPAGAWEFMGTLPPEDQARFFGNGAREFSKIKPLEVAEKLKAGEFGLSAFPGLMKEWGRGNPRQALDWSQRNLEGGIQLESLDAVFSSWGEKSPVEAAAAARNLPAGLRARILPDVAASFGATDPRAALAWAEQLPPLERSRATAGAIRGWARKDPAAAAQALTDRPSPGMDEAFDAVGRRFAQTDPAAAVRWAAALPDEKRRDKTIGNVVGAWAGQDAASASEYLAKIEPGGLRDQAIAGFVNSVRGLDPESAAAWAAAIQSPDLQRTNLRNVLRAWRGQDRAAAQAFVRGIQAESLRDEMRKLVNE